MYCSLSLIFVSVVLAPFFVCFFFYCQVFKRVPAEKHVFWEKLSATSFHKLASSFLDHTWHADLVGNFLVRYSLFITSPLMTDLQNKNYKKQYVSSKAPRLLIL